MAHIYLLFDFAKDEEKAQQARHKLELWKQAFRLDKRLLYKVERIESESAKPAEAAGSSAKMEKGKGKPKGAAKAERDGSEQAIRLFVRLGFSGHEKLSEERWVKRIPSEDPFQAASPKVIRPGDPHFVVTEEQFEDLV